MSGHDGAALTTQTLEQMMSYAFAPSPSPSPQSEAASSQQQHDPQASVNLRTEEQAAETDSVSEHLEADSSSHRSNRLSWTPAMVTWHENDPQLIFIIAPFVIMSRTTG